jgi:hypothetical protein
MLSYSEICDVKCTIRSRIRHMLYSSTTFKILTSNRTTYTTNHNIQRNRRVRLDYCWFQSNCLRSRPPERVCLIVSLCRINHAILALSATHYVCPSRLVCASKSSRYIRLRVGVIYTTSKNSVLKLQQIMATSGAASPACHSAEAQKAWWVDGWACTSRNEYWVARLTTSTYLGWLILVITCVVTYLS